MDHPSGRGAVVGWPAPGDYTDVKLNPLAVRNVADVGCPYLDVVVCVVICVVRGTIDMDWSVGPAGWSNY